MTSASRRSSARPSVVAYRRPRSQRRGGMVLVAIIVLLSVGLGLLGLMARSALLDMRQTRLRHYQLQAERLAESGLDLAAARRRGDADYRGETWRLSAEQSGLSHSAVVTIRVDDGPGDSQSAQITSVAQYPTNSVHQVQRTLSAIFNEENP